HRVEWMANAVRAQCGTDYGLAIGPLPEPDHPEPVAYFALASDMQTQVARRAYRGHPDVVLDRAAKQGLDLLRLAMLPASTD
ncbi:MAG: CinA family protein, partial [Planctomycetales bacterium]|nr:CinA family protein [Planctomycetales bacterium]